MEFIVLAGVVTLGLPALWLLRRALRARRRRLLQAAPTDPSWLPVLDSSVALWRVLPDRYRERLFGLMRIFLDEKTFEGSADLTPTDEMRLVVASQACIPILERPLTMYPLLTSVVVYPTAFVIKDEVWEGDWVTEEDDVRDGESWDQGTVVLSWDSVRAESRTRGSRFNLVLHEFAHQIDDEAGGFVLAATQERTDELMRILHREYEGLRRRSGRKRRGVMDDYGAEDPAEFFAVATEAFFGRGELMRTAHPDLYEALRLFYGLDPASWGPDPGLPAAPPGEGRKRRRKRSGKKSGSPD